MKVRPAHPVFKTSQCKQETLLVRQRESSDALVFWFLPDGCHLSVSVILKFS